MSEKILADRYRLVEQIGIGGMAIVYRAIDMRTGHNVAIKVLKPEFNSDAEFVGRFQREAEAASKMTHHNIVNLLDVGMDGNNRYLVMEYVHGKTLKQLIQEKGRLNPQVAAQITIRILSALQHAHTNGIIHRDIKPQNILVHSDGHIKVSDFGIARMANSSTLTKGDSVMGSVHYFSPEQASGQEVRESSDIYSVGVVLYEMLTGRVPFDGDNHVAIAMQHLQARPVPIETLAPDVPPAIAHVCMVAMEKNPRYRYQTATEMAADLKAAMEGRTDRMQVREAGPAAVPEMAVPHQQTDKGLAIRKPSGKKRANRGRLAVLTILATLIVAGVLIIFIPKIVNNLGSRTTVPAMVGLDLEAATQAAENAGLNVKTMPVSSSAVAAGLVINQQPDEGMEAKRGDSVSLTVSTGPAEAIVPPITGYTVEDAKAILLQSGLTINVVEITASPDVPAGLVVNQLPAAGESCQEGDIIHVTVSGGCAYVPELTGRTLNEAEELLERWGLVRSGTLMYEETEDESLHGLVAQQSPSAGSAVIEGTPVALTLYIAPGMTHRTQLTLALADPGDGSLLNVRVAIVDGGTETTVWEGKCLHNASLELTTPTAGTWTYVVYQDREFRYQQQITIE